MKKIKILTLCAIFALVGNLNANASTEISKIDTITTLPESRCNEHGYDWTKVIYAISQVESKGNPKAFNKNGNCAGLLQITPVLVREANQILAQRKSKTRFTMQDRFDPNKSKQMFILIQEKYNPTHNVEKAIRIWNGGPNYGIRSTQRYYEKVRSYLR